MAYNERKSSEAETIFETSSDVLLEEKYEFRNRDTWKSWRTLFSILTVFNLFVFGITCVMWTNLRLKDKSTLDAQKKVSFYSPVLDSGVPIDLDESTKNHTLWGDDENTSIYIQDPSPEVDAAWNLIAADSSAIITVNSEEAVRLGRDPKVIVKAPPEWGFGNDAYPAQVDVFHEIHCLNMLRKEMWWDYYFRPRYGNPENADYLHVRHKRHCLRIILRTLMCHADLDIVTHNWRRGSYRPIADFNNPRKCRNFEGLLEWNNAHAIPDDMEKWRTIKRPDNAVILPKPTPNLYTSEESEDWIIGV
ncbi:hypothetical protein HYFRA_00010665 [Hymenoscyphus fraxineus]|uniref:Tat pathway signal sequence protein n=1 Tax=Hymenoscyphus fraxineus TaxID=746836 RepID=A0A9N9PUE9_9HELO|nr:hypothetical protein HYFRA_00010665 [Hymenoscyphus fraxineus]